MNFLKSMSHEILAIYAITFLVSGVIVSLGGTDLPSNYEWIAMVGLFLLCLGFVVSCLGLVKSVMEYIG